MGLYVLEPSTAPGSPTPGAGKVVHVKHDGNIEDVAIGLARSDDETLGLDGNLYVSNIDGVPAGEGQIVWIEIP
jgi:hypothetical protein